MPPFLLLLLLVACTADHDAGAIFMLVRSQYVVAGGNITASETVEEVQNAVAKLSKGENQQAWWTLATTGWHDSAFERYLKEGPLQAEEMEELAARSGRVRDIWHAASGVVKNVVGQFNLKQVLQDLSSATYGKKLDVKGTGRVEASMWVIFFRCRTDTMCKAGYVEPLIISGFINGDGGAAAAAAGAGDEEQLTYATLWLPATSTLLVNAIPFSIFGTGASRSYAFSGRSTEDEYVDSQELLSASINVRDTLPKCPRAGIVSVRSQLDAAYGLVPGSTCIRFSSPAQMNFSLLLSLSLPLDSAVLSSDESPTSLLTNEELMGRLNLTDAEWESRPFEECSQEGLFTAWPAMSRTPERLFMCSEEQICVRMYLPGFTPYNFTCTSSTSTQSDVLSLGMQRLMFLRSVVALSESSCTDMDTGIKLQLRINGETGTLYNVSCLLSNGDQCSTTVILFSNASNYYWRLASRKSSWSSFRGLNTSEFGLAPHAMNAAHNKIKPCTMRVPSSVLSNSTHSSFLNLVRMKAQASLDSFITQHTVAFTMAKGPATDMQGFLAFIVSTAVSVLFGFAGPTFTNFLLRKMCRRWPRHILHNSKGAVRALIRVFFLPVICNVALSFCSFLPVLYLAWSEADRQKPFYTWDVGSDDVSLYSYQDDDQQSVRVVYLLSAISKYSSHFIYVSTSIAVAVCVVVFASTLWRCKRVLERYSLIQEYDSILMSKIQSGDRGSVSCSTASASAAVAGSKRRQIVDVDVVELGHEPAISNQLTTSLRAIQMTETEALELSEELKRTNKQIGLEPIISTVFLSSRSYLTS